MNRVSIRTRPRTWWLLVSMALITCAAAGAGAPRRVDAAAAALGFERSLVRGTDFTHVVYLHRRPGTSSRLHVYLEGDGSPWRRGRRPARDPTPREPLMLQLMALDPEPGVYLGRPCYHGQARQPGCHPMLWTLARYSQVVVDAMAGALRRILVQTGATQIAFFGHSGGGTLALLLAERFPETRTVVTLAGNLDPDAWAEHHGYTPLIGSLNPGRRPALDPAIRQLHLAAGRDEAVPPHLIEPVVARQPGAVFELHEDFDHACCWQRIWPSVLERAAPETAPATRLPAHLR